MNNIITIMYPSACIYLIQDNTDPAQPLYKAGKSVRHCSAEALPRLLRSYLRNKPICYFKIVSHRVAEHLESEILHVFEQRYRRVLSSWFEGLESLMIEDINRIIGEVDAELEEGKDPNLRIMDASPKPVEGIQEFHYGPGPTFRSARSITRGDMVRLCETLNDHPFYRGVCTFKPEPITEGGVVFHFLHEDQQGIRQCAVCNTCSGPWYKTIRLRYGRFILVPPGVMEEWKDNEDVVFPLNYIMTTHLKSFHGAPSFTTEELTVLAEALYTIGLVNPSVAHQRVV